MVYLSLTFWLLIVVLIAWGVQQLCNGMVRPKVLNIVLLPGTLVAQIGHVLGLLITGATISNTSLFADGESGAPATTPNPQPKIPVVGPVIIGLLPLLACATAIYFLSRELGHAILANMHARAAGPALPITLAGFWNMLHDQIRLVESIVAATISADFTRWQTWVFLYLLACLAIRIAPFPGNLRGALGAIVILGVAAATVSSLFDVADPRVQNAWAMLNFTIATLLFLLLATLLARGGIGLMKIIRTNA